MWVTLSGGTPAARKFSGSLPSVGCMVLPAPASIMITLPARRSRKLLTGMNTEPSALPTSCAAWARSMPSTRSTEVFRSPSLKPSTATSPTCMRGTAISKALPRQRDHAAGRNHDGGGEERERHDESAVRYFQNVADHDRREGAEHLRHERTHALRLAHVCGADHAVHQHLGAGNTDLLGAQ